MNNHVKALLIILIIFAVIAGLVYLLLYGVNHRQPSNNIRPLPSNQAAEAYVLKHKLLTDINLINTINAGGPNFLAIHGTDAAGEAAIVWLTGKDDDIMVNATVELKDGLSQTDIISKLMDKNITPDQIDTLFVSPYNYMSHRIIWFVVVKDIRKHWITYDFQTGDVISDIYQDPTAFKL